MKATKTHQNCMQDMEEMHLAARIDSPDLLKHLGPLGSSKVHRGGLVGSGDGIEAASIFMLDQLGNLHTPMMSTAHATQGYTVQYCSLLTAKKSTALEGIDTQTATTAVCEVCVGAARAGNVGYSVVRTVHNIRILWLSIQSNSIHPECLHMWVGLAIHLQILCLV